MKPGMKGHLSFSIPATGVGVFMVTEFEAGLAKEARWQNRLWQPHRCRKLC